MAQPNSLAIIYKHMIHINYTHNHQHNRNWRKWSSAGRLLHKAYWLKQFPSVLEGWNDDGWNTARWYCSYEMRLQPTRLFCLTGAFQGHTPHPHPSSSTRKLGPELHTQQGQALHSQTGFREQCRQEEALDTHDKGRTTAAT